MASVGNRNCGFDSINDHSRDIIQRSNEKHIGNYSSNPHRKRHSNDDKKQTEQGKEENAHQAFSLS